MPSVLGFGVISEDQCLLVLKTAGIFAKNQVQTKRRLPNLTHISFPSYHRPQFKCWELKIPILVIFKTPVLEELNIKPLPKHKDWRFTSIISEAPQSIISCS